MLDSLRAWFGRHPWYVGIWFGFCLYMTFIYGPFDTLGKLAYTEIADAEEVWFGIMLRGTAAKLTEPLHWALYAALAFGLWKERGWAWLGSAFWLAQIGVGSLIWSLGEEGGRYGWMGLAAVLLFGVWAAALWRTRPRAAS